MKTPHLLAAGANPRKIKENLSGILDEQGLNNIEDEIKRNTLGLFKLGLEYFKFAEKISNKSWRQKVSRLYYSAYNIQRSVNLFNSGHYSTDSSDHKKTGELSNDFPNREKYKNQLPILRNDRNLCDYDHTIILQELDLPPREAQDLVGGFIKDTKLYLKTKGLDVGRIK